MIAKIASNKTGTTLGKGWKAILKPYYRLTKPGIIYGNLLSAAGGFLFASRGDIHIWLFFAMAAGTSLIIASACVTNNYIDRDIDARMTRTKNRALVTNVISGRAALTFAGLLGITGICILYFLTNTLTLIIGMTGFITYAGIYTYAKRHTVHATLIGSIPGATPIAAGYTAVSGRLDITALILFVGMVIWQLPHFFAIAMFRQDEYAAAKVPVLSVVKGLQASKIRIIAYTALLILLPAALFLYSYAGYSLLIVMTALIGYWLWTGIVGLRKITDDKQWARKMFKISLFVLLALSVMLSLDAWLP